LLPYWLLFFYFAVGASITAPEFNRTSVRSNSLLFIGAVLIALMIGLRWKVGADWGAYMQMFKVAGYTSYSTLLKLGGDLGYQSLNWIVHQMGGPFWVVNLICGTIFSWGLYRLAMTQPSPWLAILVAIPYLVIVVAMGFVRQGVALGILMAGLAHFIRGGSFPRFVLYVAVASLFHRTAAVELVLVGFGSSRGRMFNVLLMIVAALVLYTSLLQGHVDSLIQNYITSQYTAQGAFIRVLMSVIPATLFFLYRDKMKFDEIEARVWRNMALAAFTFFVLLFLLPSAAVDRLALYVLPIQIAVLSRIPFLGEGDVPVRAIVIAYSAAVMFVWLNFGDNALAWVPYQFFFSRPAGLG
jgi:hypothetical protein